MAVAWGRDTGILMKLERSTIAENNAETPENLLEAEVRNMSHHQRHLHYLKMREADHVLMMSHVAVIFFAYGAGIATTILAFCVECIVTKRVAQSQAKRLAARTFIL